MTAPRLAKPAPVVPQPCNFCSRPILWLTTGRGKRMPVDALSHLDGNVLVDRQSGTCDVLGRTQAAGARAAHRPLHQHHKLTCPDADEWARKGSR